MPPTITITIDAETLAALERVQGITYTQKIRALLATSEDAAGFDVRVCKNCAQVTWKSPCEQCKRPKARDPLGFLAPLPIEPGETCPVCNVRNTHTERVRCCYG